VQAVNTGTVELSVVIPTLNERQNIVPLLERLDRALAGLNWEVIFVDDDSSDGTADEVRRAARSDRRVRCIRRVGRRGLTSACIEGIASSTAEYFVVMDADLQHDEKIIPKLLAAVRDDEYDVAIGSRYISGGGVAEGWTRRRHLFSRGATRLARQIIRGDVADPMSGFFLIKRDVFWAAVRSLSGRGFKILLDLLASAPAGLRVKEIPFVFGVRVAGESKLDTGVAVQYFLLLADKTVGRVLPIGFAIFVGMGSFGALVHLAVLWGLYRLWGRGFPVSQGTAALCAMSLNFFLNNKVTYSDRRLRGAAVFRRGLLFVLVCSIGAAISVQLAVYLFGHGIPWWLAGLCGAGVGAVWNYSVSSHIVWRRT
jgi:dolichol-phosphate mannosyltransferase